MLKLETLEAARKDNLCTYFILPLLGLNNTRFGENTNFLNTYLSFDLQHIYVEVKEYLFIDDDLLVYPVLQKNNRTFIKFEIPKYWGNDVKLFATGKYSKMSEKAKRLIREGSTLLYRKYKGSVATTDFRLMALETSTNLREMWTALIYDDYDARYRNAIEDELLSKPDENSFLNEETL